jgi:uncharacterized protein (DUF1778 family)
MRLLYAFIAHVKNTFYADAFLAYKVIAFSLRDRLWRTGCKKLPMAKSKKNKNKAKLNLTVREEQRNKLEQMASLEKRSVSNLIEVMADERWKRLAEQQGVAYAKTVADAMNLKLDADNPADREKLRRAILDLVAGRKMPKQKGASLSR